MTVVIPAAKSVIRSMPNLNIPEHDKLTAVKDHSQAIGEFLEWMSSDGIIKCRWEERHEEYFPIFEPIEKLLARYFDIDLDKLEQEKRLMLVVLREIQE